MCRDRKMEYRIYGKFTAYLNCSISSLKEAVNQAELCKEIYEVELISDETIEKLKKIVAMLQRMDVYAFDHFLEEIPVKEEKRDIDSEKRTE